MTAEIVFRATGLTKVYRNGALEVHALRGIDFQARKGEFIVILGPSGSGQIHFP
jgi:putative ABC transport system ATP-binding protein